MEKILLFIGLLISSFLTAQTKFTVIVTNGSFNPSSLTIAIGDTVEFVNQSGFHWVDGTQTTYPSNPVSFDNQSQSGSGWTYSQVFNTGGVYNYRCGIHTTTMFGSITVQFPSSVNTSFDINSFNFYPNPTSKNIFFSELKSIESIIIYSISGEKVLISNLVDNYLNVSTLSSGVYILAINTNHKIITKKLIIQ
ncbi:MAG: T9SS type A sorting domain-containing protein [Vicingus serpentipes]|nr:T9SS type A sorting domain-containing protein [Vicingus serpentipes]